MYGNTVCMEESSPYEYNLILTLYSISFGNVLPSDGRLVNTTPPMMLQNMSTQAASMACIISLSLSRPTNTKWIIPVRTCIPYLITWNILLHINVTIRGSITQSDRRNLYTTTCITQSCTHAHTRTHIYVWAVYITFMSQCCKVMARDIMRTNIFVWWSFN